MGGNAFVRSGSLPILSNFPRMSPATYDSHRKKFIKDLERLYEIVICPPAAPDKLDYGDIDLFVCAPFTSDAALDNAHNVTADEVAKALGAVEVRANGLRVHHYAVPLELAEDHQSTSNSYVQVDVNDCLNAAQSEWMVFKNSYGALWQVLGMLIKPFGLTADGEALNVRLEELENGGLTNLCRLRLTSAPKEVLDFLGLDSDAFYAGFESRRALFEWLANCNLFHFSSVEPLLHHSNSDTGHAPSSAPASIAPRKAKKYQPMVDQFMDWVASNRNILQNTTLSRAEVCERALAAFNRKKEADVLLLAHRTNIKDEALKSRIGEALSRIVLAEKLPKPAEEEKIKRIKRGLRRYMRFTADKMPTFGDSDPAATPGLWSDCPLGEDGLMQWAIDHYPDIEKRHGLGAQKALAEHRERKETARAGKLEAKVTET